VTKEILSSYLPRLVEFPSNPELIFIEKYRFPVYKYITPEEFLPELDILASKIDFKAYDGIAYNLGGGKFPYELIKSLYPSVDAFPIEYHPTGRIVTPIPKYYYDKKLLVIEDIFDTGKSKHYMDQDCLNLQMIVMSLKLEVEGQIEPKNVIPVYLTVNKWQAGVGMDIDMEKDKYYLLHQFRNYPGIVIRPPDEILDLYK